MPISPISRHRTHFRPFVLPLLTLAATLLSTSPATAQAQARADWPDDPNASRLLMGPTARSIPAGQGFAGAYEVLLPVVAYGIFDRVSLLAATPLVPEAVGRQLYLMPKVEVVRAGNVSAAGGVMAILGEDDLDAPLAMVFGVATFGGPDRALSVGAATGLADRSGAEADGVLWMLGGEQRTGRRTKLITENYSTFDGESTVLSGGVRVFGSRLAADLGVGVFWSKDETTPFPLLNVTYSFGGSR